MRKGIMSSGLESSKFGEGTNPMDGISNLADCMLVLACGLMLSLIISWNLDIQVESKQVSAVTAPIESVSENAEQIDMDVGMEKMGTVYMNPETGEMYMVMDDGTKTEANN